MIFSSNLSNMGSDSVTCKLIWVGLLMRLSKHLSIYLDCRICLRTDQIAEHLFIGTIYIQHKINPMI